MEVFVKVVGFHLKQQLELHQNGWYVMQIKEGTQIQEIFSKLDIVVNDGITYMVNGNNLPEDTVLSKGDELLLMRMIYGG